MTFSSPWRNPASPRAGRLRPFGIAFACGALLAAQSPAPGPEVGRSGQAGMTELDTDLIAAGAFASAATVAPGDRFALVVDVTPKPGMHVYAPGEHAYRVVRLRVDAPDYLRVHPLSYPPAEQYHYEPLDETVPVYQQPFRLVREVTVPMNEDTAALSAAPGGALVVTGALEYQVCDDEVCYVPATAPLRWKLAWRPLARDR